MTMRLHGTMNILLTLLIIAASPVLCHADCAKEAKSAAQSFMNEYIEYSNKVMAQKTSITPDQWVEKNNKLTNAFKTAYRNMVDKAKKAGDEGLDADPVLDAQDYPEKGMVLDSCDGDFVTLKGKDWEGFKVVVKMIKTNSGWLVDGSGIINVPKEKRAARTD